MDDNSENQTDSPQGVTQVTGSAPTGAPPPPPPSPTTPSTPPPTSPEPGPQPGTSIKPEPSQPTTPVPPGPEVTTPKEEKSGPPIYFIVLVVLILLVWGGVGYLYYTNQQLKQGESQTSQPQVSQDTLSPAPSPSFNAEDIEIINGSVYQTTGGENTPLVNKDDYPGTGIAGFATVTVSPNNSLMCFAALPPALKPALYYSSIDGIGVTQVGTSYKKCTWSNDSSMIAYINDAAADVAVDIYKYELATDVETNLTNVSTTSAVFRRYEIDSWSNDDTKILCNYQEIDPSAPSSEVLGNCEIDVKTSEVTDL